MIGASSPKLMMHFAPLHRSYPAPELRCSLGCSVEFPLSPSFKIGSIFKAKNSHDSYARMILAFKKAKFSFKG